MTPDELDFICEETAWWTIDKMGWVASPELLFALKAYVKELEGQKWQHGLTPNTTN